MTHVISILRHLTKEPEAVRAAWPPQSLDGNWVVAAGVLLSEVPHQPAAFPCARRRLVLSSGVVAEVACRLRGPGMGCVHTSGRAA